MTALSVSGVHKSFGDTEVLRGVDLHVPHGGLTAILGPSGCGKTTLLRLIAGFADPDGGTIVFGDEVVVGGEVTVPPQRRQVGYVPQEGALFPHLSVTDNITFGLPRRDRRGHRRVGELLDMVGLAGSLSGRYPHELSGGQQQRVALARALARRPAVVLLDEPFTALDAALREGTRRAVAAALRAADATAVLVTHDQSEALSLADEVGVMRDGLLVQLGSPSAVYSRPADTGVAVFVGDAVLISAVIHGNRATCALGTVEVVGTYPSGPATVLLRPEQLRIEPVGGDGMLARVREIAYYGHDATVRLDLLPDGPTVVARSAGHLSPNLHEEVRLTVVGPAVPFPASPVSVG